MIAVGTPVALTVKVPAVPTVKVAAAALVNEGAMFPSTTMLKDCDAVPFGVEADKINGKVPETVGVPLSTPVVAFRVRPAGSAPTVIS